MTRARLGHTYWFIITYRETELRRIDPYAREISSAERVGIITDSAFDWGESDEGPSYSTPPRNEMVIYQVHAGTFNAQAGGPCGFEAVTRRLAYLRDLGINCIELLPSTHFATRLPWGFNSSHIYAIERECGGPAALKGLVRTAREEGIAVILTVDYSHFGPTDLDLWRFDGSCDNHKGGIYFYGGAYAQTPWGDTRPDYGRVEVAQFIGSNTRMWLEEFRMDGLRWESTALMRNIYGNNGDPDNDLRDGWKLMQAVTHETDVKYGWKVHIAEDLRNNEWLVRDSGSGGAGFDAQWDPEFVHRVRAAIIPAYDGGRDMRSVRHAIEHCFAGDAFKRVIYTESHEEVTTGRKRVPEAIWADHASSWYSRKRSMLGAALVFTAPGIPMLFQGQEILENEWFRTTDPLNWTKLEEDEQEREDVGADPGEEEEKEAVVAAEAGGAGEVPAVQAGQRACNARKTERAQYRGVRLLYTDLIRLRRNLPGLRGQYVHVFHVNDNDNVIAFHRWDQGGAGDDVVVVLNFGNDAYAGYVIGFPRPGEWKVRLNSDYEGYGPDFHGHPSNPVWADAPEKDGLNWSGSVGIGRYAAVILSQDK